VVSKTEITAVGIRRANHVTSLYPQKLALTSPTWGGRLVGIVLSLTKATECIIAEMWCCLSSTGVASFICTNEWPQTSECCRIMKYGLSYSNSN
jgi:hypothetical protein